MASVTDRVRRWVGDDQSTESARPPIIRMFAVFGTGKLAASLLGLVGGLLTARVTSPEVLGSFRALGLVGGYVGFLQVGVLNGLGRELPYCIGRGERDESKLLASSARAWALTVGSFVTLGLLGVAIWHAVHGNIQLSVGWLTYAFTTGILSFYGQSYPQMVHRSLKSFTSLTKAMLLKSILGVVLVATVYFWGFYGLCVRSLVTSAAGASIMLATLPMKARLAWDWKRIWRLIRVGLPIFGVGYIYSLWSTLDSTLVLKYLDSEGLGLYSLFSMVQATLGILPSALGQVIYPSMSEDYGRTESVDAILRMTISPTLGIAAVAVPLVIVGWNLLPIFVNALLPQYSGGIGAAQWGMVVVAIACLQIPNNAFNVLQKQTWYAVAIACGVASYLGALCLLSRGGLTIETFPQALVVGKVAFLLISYGMLFWLWRQGGTRTT